MMTLAKKTLGFDDRWLMLIGIPLVALTTNAMMFTELMLTDLQAFFTNCGFVGLAYTVVYWVVYRWLLIFLKIKFPSQADFTKRVILQVVCVFVFFFLLKLVLDPVLHPLLSSVVEDENGVHGVSMSIASIMVTFLVLGVYETASFYFLLQKEQLEKVQLLKAHAQGQLESLRNQVNPHFFFNSLNTLAYLIPEDAAKAENFVQKLSKAYRYILEIRERELVPLCEELEFLESYTCLVQERFGENLQIDINVPAPFLGRNVVPLCMQMLFENAIKHNIVSLQHPLRIEVAVEKGDRLVVKNTLQRKQQPMASTKIGLENIRQRYRLVSNREVEVFATQSSFIVILPLLQPKALLQGTT